MAIVVVRYPATYEGVVNIIQDALITTTTPQFRPYQDSWSGVINAMKDSLGVGSLRPQGYIPGYQGFIEIVWDKYLFPSGLDLKNKYPFTFEGCVQVLIDALIPDYTHAPYSDSFQGIIDVIRDSTFAMPVSGPAIYQSGNILILPLSTSVIVTTTTTVNYLICGGGGGASGGVANVNFGSGGGSGEVKTGSMTLSPGTYSVVVGDGGGGSITNATDGGSSSFNGVVASGGTGATTGKVGGSNASYSGGTGVSG